MRRAIITSLFTVSAIALTTPAFAQDRAGATPQAERRARKRHRHHRVAHSRPHRRRFAGADRRDRRRAVEQFGPDRDQQAAQSARPVVQLPAAVADRRHRLAASGDAARPAARPGAGADQRQAASSGGADQPQRFGRPRRDRRSISTKSRRSRSTGSKCCATALRRNTVRTRSPASSTSSCRRRSGSAARSPSANTIRRWRA